LRLGCTAVPSRYIPECLKLADEIPSLIQAIKDSTPEQVCDSLNLCV
jgi:hypothetical protein